MKKTLKIGAMAAGLMAMVAGSAMAESFTINMCGASAQAGFWQKAGGAVLTGTYNCTDTASLKLKNSEGKKVYVVRGQSCDDIDGDGAADTIYVRYKAVNSDFGCQKYDNETDAGLWPTISSIDWTGGTYTTEESSTCMLGCADVPCKTICADSYGYPDGFSGAVFDSQSQTDYTGICSDVSSTATPISGVVVPFGFIVNNGVTQKVCEYADVDDDADFAYDKSGWACETAGTDDACLGNYKCVEGYCQDGIGSTECSTSADCSMADTGAATASCVEKPLKNISRLQVLHIFSGVVDNWNDFGPSYPDLAIVRCMRHAGSGTHQTLIDTVFRGDMSIKTEDELGALTGPLTFHYESSTDLTADCVARFDGAIGYVDADKAMSTDIDLTDAYAGNEYGIHQLTYQGAAPNRTAVANGEYNFWAAQTCYYEGGNVDDTEEGILSTIMTAAQEAQYLTEANFGERAYFWATQEEMTVSKANNDPAEYPGSLR